MSGIRKTGDWNGVERMLSGAGERFERNIDKATNANLDLFKGAIDQAFDDEGPGWAELNKKYEKRKIKARRNKILQWTGQMMNAIQPEKISWNKGFVGGVRNVKGKDSTVNLIEVHDQGTADGRIPARPIFDPVLEANEKEAVRNYQWAVDETFQ